MSSSLDEPPVYDALVRITDANGKEVYLNGQRMALQGWLTEPWRPWIISIKEFLDIYISVFGIQLPRITQEERDALVLTNEDSGFCCFVTTNGGTPVNLPEIYINGVWYQFTLSVAP